MKQDDGARYFGPFPNAGALRNTLALMRRTFNLRGCRPLTPTEADYKHCLYGHLKFCTAPCVLNVTHEQYKEQVTAACEFLSGQCAEMETHLDTEMRKAAQAQDYEKAAALRDSITALRHTTKKNAFFERTGSISRKKMTALIDALTSLGDVQAKGNIERFVMPAVTQISD